MNNPNSGTRVYGLINNWEISKLRYNIPIIITKQKHDKYKNCIICITLRFILFINLRFFFKNESGLWMKTWAAEIHMEKKSKQTINSLLLEILRDFLIRFPFLERILNL